MDDQPAGGGPDAPPESARSNPMAGEFVSETLLEYDGGRQVTVYVPPDPPEAVVFAGDGQGFSKWGRFLEAADVPSTMIVGVHGLAEEMPRSLPRVYLFGGTLEPFFLDNAARGAVALRDAGADVVTSERDVSHGAKLWRAEFPLMVSWAFGRGAVLR